jgi:hypothetical protein
MVVDDVEMNDLSTTIDQGLQEETVSDNVEMDKMDKTTNDEDQASNPETLKKLNMKIMVLVIPQIHQSNLAQNTSKKYQEKVHNSF